MAVWIRCTELGNSALDDIASRGTSVWLYRRLDTDDVVGFSSLGVSNFQLTDKSRVRLQLLPNYAIATAFRSQPKESIREERFAGLILRDTLREAAVRSHSGEVRNQIGLYVHPRNSTAIAHYANFKFEMLPDPARNGYRIMTRSLTADDAALPPIPDTRTSNTPPSSPLSTTEDAG